jgi:signal transduction histidine kinase
MTSIKKRLSRYISISVSILLISIFVITDVLVDSWITGEFDRALTNKAGLLITLVSEDTEEVEFEFADEFMPEFSGAIDPEYFQLWLNDEVFERSKTLDLFDVNTLPKLALPLKSSSISNIILPDGRSGKMYFATFKPQIESDVREELGITKEEFAKTQQPMSLAYAISNESLNQILWFVDIIFLITSLIAIIAVKIIVFNVVERGLRPLVKLNNDLTQIDLNSQVSKISTNNLPEELISIANGINHFISENKLLYSREKRITSDIAHELKTPIAELLSLSEVAIKFPHEKQISETFKTDVLDIAERLKNIVNGILLLQKSTQGGELKKSDIDLESLLQRIIERENKSARDIKVTFDANSKHINVSQIAIETVFSNLISNAVYYSPENSPINIQIKPEENGKLMVSITNTSTYQYSEADLAKFFEPLWQKDNSRTSSQRYGLGLAIVKSYCDNIGATLSIELAPKEQITFKILL